MGIMLLHQRGIDSVSRLNEAHRKADFRRGKRLGKDDHIVSWKKPQSIRSIDRKTYHQLPEYLTMRETRVRVEQPGFRSKSLIVVTTLLDSEEITREELANLYFARWNNELDLRTIKSTMQMNILRCRTPELVHKEVWAHALAYNLIHTIMAQAAARHSIEPRTISFKATLQTLEAFQPLIDFQSRRSASFRQALYEEILDAIALHRVANRPGRFEPRRRKRKQKPYPHLAKPRHEHKRDMLKHVTEI